MSYEAMLMQRKFGHVFENKPKPFGKVRYRCSSCHHRTPQHIAKKNGGKCIQCKSTLRAWMEPRDS